LRATICARRQALCKLVRPTGAGNAVVSGKPPVLNQPSGVLQLTSATLPPLNRLRQQWREKRPTFGAIATIPSIQTVGDFATSINKRGLPDDPEVQALMARPKKAF
jgi:hypothetical protein